MAKHSKMDDAVTCKKEVNDDYIVHIGSDNQHVDKDLCCSQRKIYEAAVRGDWKAAKTALSSDIDIARTELRKRVTKRGDTVLHVAAAAKQTAFVRNLVREYLEEEDLKLTNEHGNTAFCFAVVSGVVEIAEIMYRKNTELINIQIGGEMTPLEMAIWLRKRKMAEYLYEITNFKELEVEEIKGIFLETIHTDMYDISLKILEEKVDESRRELLYTSTKIGESAFKLLARKPLLDHHSIQGRIWEELVSIFSTIPYIPYFRRTYTSLQMQKQARKLVEVLWKQIVEVPDKYHETFILMLIRNSEIFHDAANIGNAEFLTLLCNSYPNLVKMVNKEGHSILHIAVINRLEEVVSLLYRTGVWKEASSIFKGFEDNNILHLAGRLAPPSRLDIASGAALQMQKELQWFKAMEKILRSSYVQMKNKNGQTPRELFTKEHEMLRDAGEKWMKGIATSCMVVAALIVTVVFAAAFTVPGGYKEEKGAPIFLNYGWFTIFIISDAVAMFSSTASIMMFLSLFTAQYREDDFLFSLPTKLMAGLVTLFASIIFMVLTFTAAFFLAYKEENQGTLPKFVAAFAGLPIALYALLNYRLWISLIYSIFFSTFFTSKFMFRPEKHILSLADPIWITVETLVSTNVSTKSPEELVHETSQPQG